MKCNFTIGQKVTLNDRKGTWDFSRAPTTDVPKRGAIYTITNIEAEGEFVFLTFKELSPAHSWDFRAFRPLQDRPKKTDIGVFTKLLDTRERETEPT
jgi:hypothetical protein